MTSLGGLPFFEEKLKRDGGWIRGKVWGGRKERREGKFRSGVKKKKSQKRKANIQEMNLRFLFLTCFGGWLFVRLDFLSTEEKAPSVDHRP